MTSFCFEHVFVAASPADVFEAYFDPIQLIEHDRALEIVERHVIEFVDTGHEILRKSRIVPRRQLPTVLRAFSSGPLHYFENVVGRRASHELEIELRLLGDRGRVTGRYELAQLAPGSVRRRYSGTVSVDVALVAARVERGIVAEFERSLARTAACTQNWLDQQTQRSVAARA
jgi:hypothetical protein